MRTASRYSTSNTPCSLGGSSDVGRPSLEGAEVPHRRTNFGRHCGSRRRREIRARRHIGECDRLCQLVVTSTRAAPCAESQGFVCDARPEVMDVGPGCSSSRTCRSWSAPTAGKATSRPTRFTCSKGSSATGEGLRHRSGWRSPGSPTVQAHGCTG